MARLIAIHDQLPDPPGPPSVIPFRTLLAFRRDPLAHLEAIARAHGDIVHFRFGRTHVYSLNHPDVVREVLVTRAREFIKSRALQRSRLLLGEGLLTSEGEHHLRQRRRIQPAFHRERIGAYAGVMAAHAGRLSVEWRDGSVVDMAQEMMRLTLGIAAKVLLGIDVGQKAADAMGRALSDVLLISDRLTHPLGPILDRLPVPSTRRMYAARDALDATIHGFIRERKAALRPDDGDLLSSLLRADYAADDDDRMTDRELRDEMITIFLAGHETTANALSWTWYLLSEHPTVADRVHAEAAAVLGTGTATAADYPRLRYTRNVIAEAMRLYPPAWTLGREPVRDLALAGYRLRKRSIALMSPWVIHRDSRFFPEPERFDPDRWDRDAEVEVGRAAYFPFGAGPRKCIGEGFAWMEAVVVLASLARQWRAHVAPGFVVRPRPLITLRLRDGLRMRLERRD